MRGQFENESFKGMMVEEGKHEKKPLLYMSGIP